MAPQPNRVIRADRGIQDPFCVRHFDRETTDGFFCGPLGPRKVGRRSTHFTTRNAYLQPVESFGGFASLTDESNGSGMTRGVARHVRPILVSKLIQLGWWVRGMAPIV